jgi:hypothetical protein
MYTFNEEMHICCQLIRYFRACGSYHDLLDRLLLLARKLLHQGFLVVQLKSSLLRVCSVCGNHIPVIFTFMIYHWVCSKSNTTGASHGDGITHLSGSPNWAPVITCISGVCVVHLVNIHFFTYMVQCSDVRYNVCCHTIFALLPFILRGRLGRMVVGFTTTCVISAFHQ